MNDSSFSPSSVTPERVTELHLSSVTRRSHGLVLHLFPGVDLLGRAFRAEGWGVCLGSDKLLSANASEDGFPAGRFDGVIAGTPCQDFSKKRRSDPTGDGLRCLGQFVRIVRECDPMWWVLENVPGVPDVVIDGWQTQRLDLTDVECGGVQLRLRHIQFGHKRGWIIRPRRLGVTARSKRAALATVLCSPGPEGMSFAELCRRQGLAEPLKLAGWSQKAKFRAVGNGVPIRMGRVLAEAVTRPGPVTDEDCICGCGRRVTSPQLQATAACRKRMERRRRSGATPDRRFDRCEVTFPLFAGVDDA